MNYFQVHAAWTSPILKEQAASSCGAYLTHPLVLAVLAALFSPINLHSLWKISIILLPGLGLSFGAAGLIRRIPSLRCVL